MPIAEVMFRDRDGFHYKHPERDCNKCKKYPCVKGMQDILLANFARYGCRGWEDAELYNTWKSKR